MSRPIRNVGLVLSLGLWLSVGCNDPNKDDGELGAAAAGQAARIAELESQLDQAQRDRAANEDRRLALRNEIDRLQGDLDEQKDRPGGFTSVPGGAMTSIEGNVLFDSGKADLRAGATTVLNQIAQVLEAQFANHDIYVFGHTDNEPIKVSSWKDNYELSCQRALSVVRHLLTRGVPETTMAGGWGANMPASDNGTAVGKQANRRVVIFAIRRRDAGEAEGVARR